MNSPESIKQSSKIVLFRAVDPDPDTDPDTDPNHIRIQRFDDQKLKKKKIKQKFFYIFF